MVRSCSLAEHTLNLWQHPDTFYTMAFANLVTAVFAVRAAVTPLVIVKTETPVGPAADQSRGARKLAVWAAVQAAVFVGSILKTGTR